MGEQREMATAASSVRGRASEVTIGGARILLVEDESDARSALAEMLRMRGFEVAAVESGTAATSAFARHPHDLILLDLGLPDMDGLDVCTTLRATSTVPIIVLSGRRGDGEKIAAFDAGADDYMTKPFSAEELLARIRAALRRSFSAEMEESRLECDDLVIDFDRHRVLRDSREVHLTPKEFELLAYFARHPNRLLAHSTILTAVWGAHAVNRPQHLWVLVRQLRKKLEVDPSHPRHLLSEPWIGYRFSTDAES
jgi:two-component system KDP operon response regulator KdpE